MRPFVVLVSVVVGFWGTVAVGLLPSPPKPGPPKAGDYRVVRVRLHDDGHWYPVAEEGWEWIGRLEWGGTPRQPNDGRFPNRVF